MFKNLVARVKLVCPVCGIDLPCFVKDITMPPENWVLTDLSISHLKDGHK